MATPRVLRGQVIDSSRWPSAGGCVPPTSPLLRSSRPSVRFAEVHFFPRPIYLQRRPLSYRTAAVAVVRRGFEPLPPGLKDRHPKPLDERTLVPPLPRWLGPVSILLRLDRSVVSPRSASKPTTQRPSNGPLSIYRKSYRASTSSVGPNSF